CPSCNISKVLPTPGAKPRYTFSRPRCCSRSKARKRSGLVRAASPFTMLPFGRFPRRQADAKRRSLILLAVTSDFTLVSGDDLLDDGQTQPGARLAALPGNAKKAIEDVRKILRWNAHTSVCNG